MGPMVRLSGHTTVVELWNAVTGCCTQSLDLEKKWVGLICPQSSHRIAQFSLPPLAAYSSGMSPLRRAGKGSRCPTTTTAISLTFSPDGDILVLGAEESDSKVWDSTVGTCQQALSKRSTPLVVFLSPDGKSKSLSVVNDKRRGPLARQQTIVSTSGDGLGMQLGQPLP
ncbi:uncharacterized protein P174DRAFT_418002 [Aspergillus novofumigatus IBT 16806]|uniref:Uncharacterized protein n=1 Tax=Aspergillus novofumigatus (strain IBT 16806) TaxID=1392255 RepID=A0A2I1CHB0_ASPN1|nr:uncharacterized protein P174DRAFT_418002 [Aspergillus novofumigatus IBT 16806]PKX97022.1 hypothetical protein P174DRAFT_418002 [Aspergillus novofumigatus IBT 16806]